MAQEKGSQTPSNAPDDGINRRIFNRIVCHVDVTLESESNFYNGFTENISSGGLFIATYDLKPLGQKLKLEFTIPGREKPVEVNGEIRWVREYNDMYPDVIPGMGVRFLDLHPDDSKAIDQFIMKKDTIFYDDE